VRHLGVRDLPGIGRRAGRHYQGEESRGAAPSEDDERRADEHDQLRPAALGRRRRRLLRLFLAHSRRPLDRPDPGRSP
jgi:hypothetical protein